MTFRLSSLLLLGLAFAGCASASGSGAVFALALFVSVAATACLEPGSTGTPGTNEPEPELCYSECDQEWVACEHLGTCNYFGQPDTTDTGVTDAAADGDAEADALCWNECGYYEPCDERTPCNYWDIGEPDANDVGDADAHVDADAEVDGPDVDDADTGECWYECAGELIPCDWSCNYWEVWEPDASYDASYDSGAPDSMGPDAVPDAAGSDAEMCDGVWEPCCVEGTITECCCPGGGACNYGWFEICPDTPQTCVMPGETCPP